MSSSSSSPPSSTFPFPDVEFDMLADDCCSAWEEKGLKIPNFTPTFANEDDDLFYVKFEVEFVHPPSVQLEGEDDYVYVLPCLEASTVLGDFWFPCKKLESRNLPWPQISSVLTTMKVPLYKQPFMLNCICTCADRIANASCNRNKKVLPMMVSISVVVDYLLYEYEDPTMIGMRVDGEVEQLRSVPASAESIEALDRVVVDANWLIKECSICLERLQVGSAAMRMPCSESHIYHENCIANWLTVSSFCPLCRFQLPAN